jgi:hypothetical protein
LGQTATLNVQNCLLGCTAGILAAVRTWNLTQLPWSWTGHRRQHLGLQHRHNCHVSTFPCVVSSRMRSATSTVAARDLNWVAHLIVDTNNCELRWPLQVDTWEGGEDRKTIAHRERERNHFLVLYDVKQLGSGYRSIATEDSCE